MRSLSAAARFSAAAEALFAEGGGELPTVQAIADRAGVAKGTLYLYFATVEDVFIALVGEHTARAMSDAQERLRRSRPPLTPDKVAAAMSVYAVEHPVAMQLATVSASFRSTRPGTDEAYQDHQRQTAETIMQFGQFLEENLPGLAKGKGSLGRPQGHGYDIRALAGLEARRGRVGPAPGLQAGLRARTPADAPLTLARRGRLRPPLHAARRLPAARRLTPLPRRRGIFSLLSGAPRTSVR